MHSTSVCQQDNLINIKFPNYCPIDEQNSGQHKLSELIKQKYDKKERFYGIEISASSSTNDLDYGLFKILPLFTTIVWIDKFADIEPIAKIPQFDFVEKIKPFGIVAPHLNCYKLTREKLKNYLDLMNVQNIFAVRGETVQDNQFFKHASDLVKEIRKLKGDEISIGVAGHPEIHKETNSLDEDLRNLKIKVDEGASFIITQVCFNSEAIINFIKKCRQIDIKIPIIPLVFTPSNYQNLELILRITNVSIANNLLAQYEEFKDDIVKFQEFSVQKSIEFINSLFNSDVNILGVHFLTLNHFDTVQKVVKSIF